MIIVLAVPVLLAAAVWLGFALFNADEPLTPETERALRLPALEFDEGNAFLALVGLRAPAGSDSAQAGFKALERARGKLAGGNASPVTTSIEFDGATLLPMAPFVAACPEGRGACPPTSREVIQRAQIWVRDHPELWERYLHAIALPRYWEFGGDVLPSAFNLFSPSIVLQQQVLALWMEGRAKEALSLLSLQTEHCRRVLASGGSLITTMLATRCVDSAWQLIAVLALLDPAAARTDNDKLDAVLRPFDPKELDFSAAMRGELRFGATVFLEMRDGRHIERDAWDDRAKAFLWRPFFLPNATINRRQAELLNVARMAELPDAALLPALDAARAAEEQTGWRDLLSRNPGGELVLGSTSAYFEYLLRLRGLEATRRLSLLVLDCLQRDLLPAQPAACAAGAPASLRHPFSGGVPEVDAEAGLLRYPVEGMQATRQPSVNFRP